MINYKKKDKEVVPGREVNALFKISKTSAT